jgi:hypothetical protein
MSTFMRPTYEPPASVFLVVDAFMKSSYRKRWRLLRRQVITTSDLGGSCFATSRFNRRSRNGRSTVCSRPISASFSESLPSTIPATGSENHSYTHQTLIAIRGCVWVHEQRALRTLNSFIELKM